MADIAGFGGNFASTSIDMAASIDYWSATLEADTIPIPASFGEAWEGAVVGQGRLTGSARGKVTTTQAPLAFPVTTSSQSWTNVAQGTLSLTASSGKAITITNAVLYNVSIDRPHNGVATWSADFRGDGSAIAETW